MPRWQLEWKSKMCAYTPHGALPQPAGDVQVRTQQGGAEADAEGAEAPGPEADGQGAQEGRLQPGRLGPGRPRQPGLGPEIMQLNLQMQSFLHIQVNFWDVAKICAKFHFLQS